MVKEPDFYESQTDKSIVNKPEWKEINSGIENLKKRYDEIKKEAGDIKRLQIGTLELYQERIDELKININDLYWKNHNYYLKKDNRTFEFFERKINNFSSVLYNFSDKIRITIANKKSMMNNVKTSKKKGIKEYGDKFEFLYRNAQALNKQETGEYNLNNEAHNELNKILDSIPTASFSDLTDDNYELFSNVLKCIKNYKEHYGEMPTPEMISDILNVPINVVTQIIENDNNYKRR